MKRWWCMDCRGEVEMDRHGRCGVCESEAVILAESDSELNGSVPVVKVEAPGSLVCA
jgi:Zn finger protein HypA/HybF involved in hydrogenase expression